MAARSLDRCVFRVMHSPHKQGSDCTKYATERQSTDATECRYTGRCHKETRHFEGLARISLRAELEPGAVGR
jgi:hypothetical protein